MLHFDLTETLTPWSFWSLLLSQNTLIFPPEGKESSKHIFTLEHLRATRSLSATNSIYCFIRLWFIPMSFTGRASVRNSCSMTTASLIISLILSSDGLFLRYVNIKQAQSQWRSCVTDIITIYFKYIYFQMYYFMIAMNVIIYCKIWST